MIPSANDDLSGANSKIEYSEEYFIELLAKEQAEKDSIAAYVFANRTIEEKIVDINKMHMSFEGRKFLKKLEGYKSHAYKLGDGMITIGYGHAERISKSQYKIGDSITQLQGERLFIVDLMKFERGVKRTLIRSVKNGGNADLDQNQFDALVSMAYNMGIYGLANTTFMGKVVYSDDPMDAAKYIPNTRTRGKNGKVWKGLERRRVKEYNMFVGDLN
jgi:lysozyme